MKRDRAEYMRAYRAKKAGLRPQPGPLPDEIPMTRDEVERAIANLTQAERDAILRKVNRPPRL